MGFKAHKFVGLANPVYLPDDIEVEIAIVPSHVKNVRSNQKRPASAVKFFTVHETANFQAGANAEMHKRWLHGGAGGSYVGFNLVVDDKKVIQLTPFDETTWAAGTADGNWSSDHMELCVHAGINHTKARRIAAAVAAGVIKARGLSASALCQHNKWYGKNCPSLMRANDEHIWKTTFVPSFRSFLLQSEPAPAPAPAPGKTYASPVRIREADGEKDVVILDNGAVLIHSPLMVKTIRPTRRLQTAWSGSDDIGPTIAANEDFVVHRLIINSDGSMYWYTPYATRVKYEDTKIVGGI